MTIPIATSWTRGAIANLAQQLIDQALKNLHISVHQTSIGPRLIQIEVVLRAGSLVLTSSKTIINITFA